jgi:anti-sigma factor RsiW
MPQQPLDEQRIKDYLLGASPEAETERLDEMSLTDDEFVERLRGVENDLVDAYTKGELSRDELARFDSHYLASPRRREKVRFAQAFAGFVNDAESAQADEGRRMTSASSAISKGARERSGFSLFAFPRLQWGFAAASVLLLLAGGYLIFENARLRNQMSQVQAERSNLERREQELLGQLADQKASDAKTEQELQRVRERLAQLDSEKGTPSQGAQHDLKVIAFNLVPQTRGVSQIPALPVPTATDQVALTLELETNDFPAYRAALRNPVTGQIIWRSRRLNATVNKPALRISLPAHLLKAQNYVVELSGVSASGQTDYVGSYPFRVLLH